MHSQADLKHLHVLLVGGKPASVQVLRTAFGLLGLNRITAVSESARAIDALRGHPYSAIFCDAEADTFQGMPFPVAARRAHGVLNPMAPLFVLYHNARQSQVELARDVGVTDVLAHPISAATIARKLEAAILAPRPFIAAPTFFGPDRRSKARTAWSGDERRTRVAKKTKVSLAEVQTAASDVAFV